jgi:hypothetical protein
MIQTAWHKLVVDLLDESEVCHVKLRGPKLDRLANLMSLHSVASPALNWRGGDRTSKQLGSEFIALLSRGRSIRREEDEDLCLG